LYLIIFEYSFLFSLTNLQSINYELIERRDSVSRQIYFSFTQVFSTYCAGRGGGSYKNSSDCNQFTHSDSVMREGRTLSDAKTRRRRASWLQSREVTNTRLAFAERARSSTHNTRHIKSRYLTHT